MCRTSAPATRVSARPSECSWIQGRKNTTTHPLHRIAARYVDVLLHASLPLAEDGKLLLAVHGLERVLLLRFRPRSDGILLLSFRHTGATLQQQERCMRTGFVLLRRTSSLPLRPPNNALINAGHRNEYCYYSRLFCFMQSRSVRPSHQRIFGHAKRQSYKFKRLQPFAACVSEWPGQRF